MRAPVFLALAGIMLTTTPVLAQRGRFGDRFGFQNGWLSSLSAGKREAQRTGKPLMVVLRCVP
jgi:hypothetical protein